MSYQSVVEMASSQSLLARITAAAAAEGQSDPLVWSQSNIWALAASPDWDDAWDFAKAGATLDVNPDTGARPTVIGDQMILAAVQALRTAQAG